MQKETSNHLHLRGLLVWAQNMLWEATKIMEDGAPLVKGLCVQQSHRNRTDRMDRHANQVT